MPVWSPLEAKKEATRRVKARRSRFRKPETVQARIAQEAAAAKGMARLLDWCKAKGYEVRFGRKKKDYIFYDLKRITICTRPSLESQLIGLLHECGHLLLNRDRATYNRRFGRGWPVAEGSSKTAKKSLVHRVQLFEEEVEAWNRGERLARRLGISIGRPLWNQWRSYCLRSYAGYAAGNWSMKDR